MTSFYILQTQLYFGTEFAILSQPPPNTSWPGINQQCMLSKISSTNPVQQKTQNKFCVQKIRQGELLRENNNFWKWTIFSDLASLESFMDIDSPDWRVLVTESSFFSGTGSILEDSYGFQIVYIGEILGPDNSLILIKGYTF